MRFCVLRLNVLILTAAVGLTISGFSETFTLLSDTDFNGAARWSLIGLGEQGSGWVDTGWSSRLSSAADPNGTGELALRVYVDIADAGSRFLALRQASGSWAVDGFDRFGRSDGTTITLAGVTPGTHEYKGIATDESTGDLYLLRKEGVWLLDRFHSSGTLLNAAAVQFNGSGSENFVGVARTSTGTYHLLAAPVGGFSYRIHSYTGAGLLLEPPRSVLDQGGMETPTDRLLVGLAASSAPRSSDGDVIGPFLNGAFARLGRINASSEYMVVPAYPGLQFTEPSAMIPDPTGPRFFVAERPGIISWISTNEASAEKHVMLDIRDSVKGGGEVASLSHESGLYNIILHPDYAENGYLYAFYTWTANGNDVRRDFNQSSGHVGLFLRLSRFTVNHQTLTIDPDSELVMFHLRVVNGSHRGGGMAFDEEGFLYVATGEFYVSRNATNITGNLLGSVLRLDVDMRGGSISHPPRRRMGQDAGVAGEISGVGYYIPNSNPFNDPNGSVFEEHFEIGHRNPYRMSFDPPTGNIWISEVGDKHDEVNILDRRGGGHGMWPYDEGFDDNPGSQPAGVLFENPAVMEFSPSEARALIGGYVYRGTKFPELVGKYIMGDFVYGTVWAATYDPEAHLATREVIATASGRPAGWGQDPYNGEIFTFYASAGGEFVSGLYKLVKVASAEESEIPPTLSATGAFLDLGTLQPAPGLYPYEPISPLWSDNAGKQRWIAIPSDGRRDSPAFERISFSELENYEFPVGTVFVKHFELGSQRLETRFLIHRAGHQWTALTYKWRPDNSDADLVVPEGDQLVYVAEGEVRTWNIPSRTACFQCHGDASGIILGFRTRQLNSDYSYDGLVRNQLLWLNDREVFDVDLDPAEVAGYLTSAPLDDPNVSLEKRVRSYLDSNCSHCHRPGGKAGRSTWNALLTANLEESGILYGPVIDSIQTPQYERIVVPKYPTLSQIYLRLEAGNPCCSMPPLAVTATDHTARNLVDQWIRTLNQLPASTPVFIRPVDVIAHATWQGSMPGGMVGNNDTWALHLIQAPGTAIGDPEIDATLNEESPSATHPQHAGGNSFGQWHSDDTTTGYLLFDLGATYPLGILHIWQANQTGFFNRGVRDFDILVADSPAAFDGAQANNLSLWTPVLENQVLAISTGGNISAQNFPMSGVPGRYVQIKIKSNHGAATHVGLSEVRVTTYAGGDFDGDGIPDSEEGLGDSDGDGIPNVMDPVDDSPITVSVVASDPQAGEPNNNGVFTITRTGPTTSPLTVSFVVAGTATPGIDYVSLGNSVTIAAGATSTNLNVVPINDSLPEGPETIDLNIVPGIGYAVGSPAIATINLADDDQVTVTVGGYSLTAAEPSEAASITVNRTGSTASPLSVNFTLTGTALNGTDYVFVPSPITFAIGSSTATINIVPINDSIRENTETIILTLQPGAGYAVGPSSTANIALIDDDFQIVNIVANDNVASESGGNTASFTVSRIGSVASSLFVPLIIQGTAINGADYNPLSPMAIFNPGESSVSIPIVPINDATAEPSETVILSLLPGVGYELGVNTSALVVLHDDDAEAPRPGVLRLDGVDDYATRQESIWPASSSLSSYTVEAWIYPRSINGFRFVAADDAFDFDISSGAVTHALYGPLASFSQVASPSGPNINQWNHVAIMFEGATRQMSVALNGVVAPIGIFPGASFYTDPSQFLTIGGRRVSPKIAAEGFFHGEIDQVRLSDVVRYTGNFTPPTHLSSDGNTRALYHFDESAGSSTFIDSSGNGRTLTGIGGAQTASLLGPEGVALGPVGHWTFDELSGNIAADRSGHGNNGVLSGGPVWDGTFRKRSSLSFDGIDDVVTIPNSPELEVGRADGDFTVACWINLQQSFTGSWRTIMQKGENGATRTFSLYLWPTSNQIHYRVSTVSEPNEGWNSSAQLPVGTWTHLTLVKRGNRLRLYFNGVLDSERILSSPVIHNSGPLYMGDTPWTAATRMLLDDVRVYRRGLTDGEVLELAGLVGHWTFFEGSGSIARDSSAYNNTVTFGSGSQAPLWLAQGANQVLSFDGIDDVATIANATELELGRNNGDFSVAFWVNLLQGPTGSWRTILQKGANGATRTFSFFLYPDSNRIHWRVSTVNNSNEGSDSIASLPLNTWTHVAMVKSGNDLRLYLNGALDRQRTLASAVVHNNGPIYIGDTPWTAATKMNFDDLRLYNRALPATLVASLATRLPSQFNAEPGPIVDPEESPLIVPPTNSVRGARLLARTDPSEPGDDDPPIVNVESDVLVIRWPVLSEELNDWTIELSEDLANWKRVDSSRISLVTGAEAPVMFELRLPLQEHPRVFLRKRRSSDE